MFTLFYLYQLAKKCATKMTSYEKYVVVAEDEWKISNNGLASKFSLAGLQWECKVKRPTTAQYGVWDGNSSLRVECKDVASGKVQEVHVEISLCDAQFKLLDDLFPIRQALNPAAPAWEYSVNKRAVAAADMATFGASSTSLPVTTAGGGVGIYVSGGDVGMGGGGPRGYSNIVYVTIRILKERSSMPDFTKENVNIGAGLPAKGVLTFLNDENNYYVNKELLSLHSPVFRRIFKAQAAVNDVNGTEDNGLLFQPAVDPALFQDFLLCISVTGMHTALPNPQNVVGLLKLAERFQVELVREKCERHLKHCREMTTKERIKLAREYGLKELQLRIVQEMNTLERSQELCSTLWDMLNEEEEEK